ncbi:deoxynucleoside kinase (plasmid) [Halobacillus litoralis]|uniref:deoxynucleoside kinase n=1 Tax=Halobacillus litoralis TaxID=45668 RepID=UPI001CFE25A4|nr:deoxynucleoside kinase [Halobacillus litoralis]WLR49558.1 deoxynucleoside kinase [Halobacillus litoralis]
MDKVITISGMIGTGKSSLAELLAERLGSEAFYESVGDNPVLDKFYEDKESWAFHLQVHFLNERFKSIKKALTHRDNVLDRSIYEDALFTKINYEMGNMDEVSYNLYLDLLDNMMQELEELPKKSPDLMIYLYGSFDEVLRRINKRGRDFENTEDNPELYEYFKTLHANYNDWARDYRHSDIVWVNIDQFDFVENEEDKEIVLKSITDLL